MIKYKHPLLPEFSCWLENNFVHFRPTEFDGKRFQYESTNKKVINEQGIANHLDNIFSDKNQLDCLISHLEWRISNYNKKEEK